MRCRAGPEAIAAGSYTEGDCSKGAVIRFRTPARDGILSLIVDNRPNERLSIKHVGTVNKAIDDTESDEVMTWASAYENYTLKEINRGTELTVDMDVMPEYQTFFPTAWPTALEAIKRLSETVARCAARLHRTTRSQSPPLPLPQDPRAAILPTPLRAVRSQVPLPGQTHYTAITPTLGSFQWLSSNRQNPGPHL